MRHPIHKILFTLSLGLALPSMSLAAPMLDHPCAFHQSHWQEAAIESIAGKITDVKISEGCMEMHKLLQLTLQTQAGEVLVHVGPTWYITPKVFRFALGDEITVKGNRFESEGKTFLVAAEIDKEGSAPLILRDKQGLPVWHEKAKGK